jgi:hypothetical protein
MATEILSWDRPGFESRPTTISRPGNSDVQSDPDQIAVMMAPVLTLDGDAARHDLIEEPVELRGIFTYSVLDAG